MNGGKTTSLCIFYEGDRTIVMDLGLPLHPGRGGVIQGRNCPRVSDLGPKIWDPTPGKVMCRQE